MKTKNDKKKAGRKPLPKGIRRVRLAAMVSPETASAFSRLVDPADPRDNLGRVLDRLAARG